MTELQAAVAARDRFIAAVGHELRNSMAPLVMLADGFTDPSTPMTERRMQMLSRNLKRLSGILERVTDVAQLRDEKLILARETVDLGALIQDVVAELSAEAAAAKVEFRVEAATVPGSWDRARLRQIVFHLVGNAVRHSGGGPVDISLRSDDEHAVLTVADRGRGIDPARRARLFDAFDAAEPSSKGGLGVGLWIVSTLCRHFKGTVSLVEDHAPGACFRVVLPRV